MLITRKKLHNLIKEAYEHGLTKGYDLAWQMRQVERNNRGFIIAGKLDQELEEILRHRKDNV